MENLTIITLNENNIQDFAAARNRALAQASTDWVLFVDQDEVVSDALRQEITRAINSNKYQAYTLKRQDTFMGRQLRYGETSSIRLVRLASKKWGHWERPVHEQWVGDMTKVGELNTPLNHNPHKNMSTFINKINYYSDLESKYRWSLGKRANLFNLAFFPPAKFVYNFLFRQGFRDGVPGLIMALMMSYHSFLTWAKLYLLCHAK